MLTLKELNVLVDLIEKEIDEIKFSEELLMDRFNEKTIDSNDFVEGKLDIKKTMEELETILKKIKG